MQVLFCHDGPLRKDQEGNYYGIAHNDQMFKRYFSLANKIATVMRISSISSNEDKTNLSKIEISPFKVYELPNLNTPKNIIISRAEAKKIMKNAVLESDYIVARVPSMSGFLAIDYAKKYNKPYITEIVTCPWDAYWNHSFKGKLVAPFMFLATRTRVKESSHVIYVTNEFLQSRYPTNGESVSCSNVILTEIDERVLKRRLKKIENMDRSSKIIIGTTAAVNVRFKGQQYVIKALGELKKKGYTNFEYQLVGPGDQSYLKSVAKRYGVMEQVKFLGVIPHKKVFNWLDTIDIYVQPSKQEGLPRALIEAMSRGVPAFGAHTAGIPELLNSHFIFSNTFNNIKEICSILLKFDKGKMFEQAERNFECSKKYEENLINNRRYNFFRKFKLSIQKNE